ncbi:MAG: hypothetical protein GF418_01435 [Chitinivibrionales bacterium]|nr:hypothetical protein [Chitinivibrionales bacterium]MBD3394265.1 hypothetical protein [Chitinivibrionales bacterium]
MRLIEFHARGNPDAWIQHGNVKAAKMVDADPDRFISIISYMELLQNGSSRQQHLTIKDDLQELEFVAYWGRRKVINLSTFRASAICPVKRGISAFHMKG